MIQVLSKRKKAFGNIRCKKNKTGFQYSLDHSTEENVRPVNADYVDLSTDQLWHRLTSVPNLAFVSLKATSHVPSVPSDQLKHFAEQCFDFLCTTQGYLTFHLAERRSPFDHPSTSSHNLVMFRGICKHGEANWQSDGEDCIVPAPKLDFNNLPQDVDSLSVHLTSLSKSAGSSSQQCNHCSLFDAPCMRLTKKQTVVDFADVGNIDLCALDKLDVAPPSYDAFPTIDWDTIAR